MVGFWDKVLCCCGGGGGNVSWRRYNTSSPPAMVRYWDSGFQSAPIVVSPGDGPCYEGGGNGPGSQALYLNGWPNSGPSSVIAPSWSDNLGNGGGATVSPSGSPILWQGSWTLPPQPITIPMVTGLDDGFQSEAGVVSLTDTSDSITQATEFVAFRFENLLFTAGQHPTNLQVKLSLASPPPSGGEWTVYWENVANSTPLAATADNISSRAAGNTLATTLSGPDANGFYTINNLSGQYPWLLSGWNPGNAATVIMHGLGAGTLNVNMYESGQGAELTYTVATAPHTAVLTDSSGDILSYDAAAIAAFGPIPPSPIAILYNTEWLSPDWTNPGFAIAYQDGSFGAPCDYPQQVQILQTNEGALGNPYPANGGTYQITYCDSTGTIQSTGPLAWDADVTTVTNSVLSLPGLNNPTIQNASSWNPTGAGFLKIVTDSPHHSPFWIVNNTTSSLAPAGVPADSIDIQLYTINYPVSQGVGAGFARYDVGVWLILGIDGGSGIPSPTFMISWEGGTTAPIPYLGENYYDGLSPGVIQSALIAAGLTGCFVTTEQDGPYPGGETRPSEYWIFAPFPQKLSSWPPSWTQANNATFSINNSTNTFGLSASITFNSYAFWSRWVYPRFNQATLHNMVIAGVTQITSGTYSGGIFTDAAGTLDVTYATALMPGTAIGVQAWWRGFLQPNNATLQVMAKNFTTGNWETIGTITGIDGSATDTTDDPTQLFPLTPAQTSSSHIVSLRFYGTGLPSPVTFFVDPSVSIHVQYQVSGPAIDVGEWTAAGTDGDKTYIVGNNRQLIRLEHDGTQDYIYEVPLAPQNWAASPARFLTVDPTNGTPYVGGDYVAFQSPG